MDKFDKVKFYKMLKTLPMPVAHTVFIEPQTAPYLIYRDDDFELTAANSKTVYEKNQIILELYTKLNQTEYFEEIVETFLNDITTFNKSRSFIAEEQLYITYFEFYL